MSIINLYKPIRRSSYVLTSILILLILSYQFLFKSSGTQGILIVSGVAVVLFILWRYLRPGASGVQTAKEVFEAIGNGRPTFLNIYSNY